MKYKITAYNDSVKLEIIGVIGDEGFTYADFRAAVGSLDISSLEIDINSPGGDVFEAFAIHDAIKTMKSRVTVNIIGLAASAATIIAAAADVVRISENSKYLIHESSIGAQGKKDDLKEAVKTLEQVDEQMMAVYIKRTGKSRVELEKLSGKDTYLTAQEALEWGFVDEIIEVKQKNIKTMNERIKVVAESKENDEEKNDEMEALLAKLEKYEEEIETLKSKLKAFEGKEEEEKEEDEIETLKSKLKAFEEKEEEEKEEKAESLVSSAVEHGLIKPDTKDKWKALAIADYQTTKETIEGIILPEHPAAMALKKNEVNGVNVHKKATSADLMEMYKDGKIKNQLEFAAALKELEG